MGQLALGIYGVVSYLALGSTRATWGSLTNGEYVGAGPALLPFTSVRSATLNITDGEANATTRAAAPWKLTGQALSDADIDIECLWIPGDAAQKAFLQAKLTRVSIAVALLDMAQATSGASGIWADFAVMDYTREEPEDKEMTLKIKLKPTLSNVPPEWVAVP